jgi:hypothetical protein
MHALRFAALPTALMLAGWACSDNNAPAAETFHATLNGAKVRPTPVTTTATGTATFTVSGSLLTYTLNVTGMDSVFAAHIHAADTGSSGGVMVPLFTGPTTAINFSGTLAQDTVTVVDSVLTRMRNGTAYVNVHTTAYPGGEIRGQIEKP